MENKRVFTQPFVVVGVIIEKNGKFLLVQEAQKEPGKWNQPAGWLDLKEEVINGAKREAEEETGLEIKIIGFLGVYPLIKVVDGVLMHPIKLIFAAKPLTEKIKIKKGEILEVKWFTLDEIKALGKNLRDFDIIKEVEDYLVGKIYPLEIIKPNTDSTKL